MFVNLILTDTHNTIYVKNIAMLLFQSTAVSSEGQKYSENKIIFIISQIL